jgi:hypothetical protein
MSAVSKTEEKEIIIREPANRSTKEMTHHNTLQTLWYTMRIPASPPAQSVVLGGNRIACWDTDDCNSRCASLSEIKITNVKII